MVKLLFSYIQSEIGCSSHAGGLQVEFGVSVASLRREGPRRLEVVEDRAQGACPKKSLKKSELVKAQEG